nr:Major facilitator superfamily MFS-1 domain containing protein [Haemonchus contortus]
MDDSGTANQPLVIKHLDDIVVLGRYTMLVCLLTELAFLSQLSNTMYMVYAGSSPMIRGCGNMTFATMEEACANLHQCEGLPLELESQFFSVNEEWEIHCEQRYLERRSTSLQMLGVMIGSLSSGQISSSFGRKKPMVVCLTMTGLLSLATYFVNDLVQFTIIRFILGIFTGGHSTVVMVYLLENIPKKSRMWINTVINYSPNVIILGIIAYFFQHWRSLALVISALHIPAVILMIQLHESPRWLVQRGKIHEARRVILRIAHIDGDKAKIDEKNLDQILKQEHDQFEIMGKKRHTYWHVFKKAHLAFPLLILSFSFFACMVVNYANMFNLGSLSGSIYLNSILVGSLRYSSNLTCGLLDYKFLCFGRKRAHTACQLLVLVSLLTSTVIFYTGHEENCGEIVRVCVLIVCAMASQIVIVDSVACNELFPTSVRTLCYSFVQLCSRMGIVVAPHVYSWEEIWHYLPYTFMIVVTVMDVILFEVVLPETKNKPLEDHIVKRPKKTTARQA